MIYEDAAKTYQHLKDDFYVTFAYFMLKNEHFILAMNFGHSEIIGKLKNKSTKQKYLEVHQFIMKST